MDPVNLSVSRVIRLFMLICYFSSFVLWADSGAYLPHQHPALLMREHHVVLAPRRVVELSSEVGGKVSQVKVELGDRIAEPVLIVLDATQQNLEIQNLKAEHDMQAAQLERLETQMKSKASERSHLQRELKRQKDLLDGGGGSEQAKQAAEQQLEQVDFQSTQLQNDKTIQLRSMDSKKIALQKAQDWLRRYHIKMSDVTSQHWQVIEREVEPGEVITQGQVLLTCAQVDVLMLSLLMDDRELSACLAGDWALTTESGEVVNGFRPFFVSPMVSGDSRKREIRFEGASTPKVTAGQALRLKLKLPSNSGGVLVPQTHINDRFGQMMVLTKEGTSLPVKVLRKKGSSAVVESSTLPKGVVLMPIMEEGAQAP